MKKLIFLLAMACLIGTSAKAQDPVIFQNNFNCGLILWINCWDCNGNVYFVNQVHIPGNSNVFILPSQACAPNEVRTYQICYDVPSGCDATCSNYASPIGFIQCDNITIGTTMLLPPCETCTGTTSIEAYFTTLPGGQLAIDTRIP